jgi:hypothetical protein
LPLQAWCQRLTSLLEKYAQGSETQTGIVA